MPDRDFHTTIHCILVFVILLIFVMSHGTGEASAHDEFELSIEVIVNPVKGSPHIACISSSRMESNRQEKWITFGKVKPHKKKGWKAFNSEVRSAEGPSDKILLDFECKSLGRLWECIRTGFSSMLK